MSKKRISVSMQNPVSPTIVTFKTSILLIEVLDDRMEGFVATGPTEEEALKNARRDIRAHFRGLGVADGIEIAFKVGHKEHTVSLSKEAP